MSDIFYSEAEDRYIRQNENGDWVDVPKYAAERGAFESAMIAAGEKMTNIGRTLGLVDDASPFERQAMRDLREVSPVATTVGDMLPAIAAGGAGGALMRGMGAAANVVGQGAIGASEGYLTSGGDMGQAAMGLAGGAGGEIAGRIAGRVFNAAKGWRSPERDLLPMEEQFIEQGGKLPSIPRTSPETEMLARNIESNPVMNDLVTENIEANEQLISQKVVDALDLPGVNDLTDFAHINDTIAGEFSNIAKDIKSITMPADFVQQITDLTGDSVKFIKDPALRQAMQAARSGELTGSVKVPADYAMRFRTILSRNTLAKNELQQDAAIDAVTRFDELVTDQAGAGVAKRYEDLRKKQQLLFELQKPSRVSAEGRIKAPGVLKNRLESKNMYGRDYTRTMAGISEAMGDLGKTLEAFTSDTLTNRYPMTGFSKGAQGPQGWASSVMMRPLYERAIKEGNITGALTGIRESGGQSPWAAGIMSGLSQQAVEED